MAATIDSFRGEYRFLSNFWPCQVRLDDVVYQSVEHAYQAAKSFDPKVRQTVQEMAKPGDAKRFGKSIQLRPDWHDIKLWLMYTLLREKFFNPDLTKLLLATRDAELIEGNTWHDNFWGVCSCDPCKKMGPAENNLGKLLMRVRQNFFHSGESTMRDVRVMRLVDFARRHLEHAGTCPKYGFTAGISVPRCLCGADAVMEMFREAFLQ